MEASLAEIHVRVAAAVPEREAIVHRGKRLTYAQVSRRTSALSRFLRERGMGKVRPRHKLLNHESGQDHIAICLLNGNEYIEAMLGSLRARAVPININYKYTAEEMAYVFRDAKPPAVVYHLSFGPTVAAALAQAEIKPILIHVEDDSGTPPLPGSVDFESQVTTGPVDADDVDWSPDDLYVLYTGGTTGMPKGVLWRGADLYMANLGGRRPDGTEISSIEEAIERAVNTPLQRVLPTAPMMHGGSQWAAVTSLLCGYTVVIQDNNQHFDPADILRTVEREKATLVFIVGDALARPLIEEARLKSYDLTSVHTFASGGAPLSTDSQRDLLTVFPSALILNVVGSSETGSQGTRVSQKADPIQPGNFQLGSYAAVLSGDRTRVLAGGDDEVGWLAQRGRVPLGYLNDARKTAEAFPVIDGVRWAVPGDRAVRRPDGTADLLGRDSITINSGGEKIFVEEVESAVKSHPAVADVVVCGRPSERWGQEVVAIVSVKQGATVTLPEIQAACSPHIARYKFPKALVIRDAIERTPAGKPDYRWARVQANDG